MTAVRQDKLVSALVGDFARVTHTHVGGSLTFALNDATDVQITAAAAGDYLRYDGVSQWVDVAASQVLADVLGADATLAALAAYNTNGLLTQTAADTFTGRSIAVGAGGYLSVSNGNGVSGNPTLDLADAELLALAGLTSAANQLPYFTGSGTAALTTLSAFMRTLLDDADAATARTTLEVAVGTNVQAYDAFLTSIAALGTAANRMIYTTGVDTAAETALTAFARSILDDADEATFKATVNLEIGVDVQAHDSDLDALATLAATAGMLSRTGANAFAARTLTAPAAGFTITNNTGAAGNPTFVLANDLGALEGLASTGIAVRSAADTWVQRSIAQGNNIAVTNGDGVSGNPTIAATASGSDGQVQYNNGGTNFGGNANFIFDDTNNIAAIAGSVQNPGGGITASMPGFDLRVGDVSDYNNASYFPLIKWLSTDSSFTTTNPKLVAAIACAATENYSSDTAGGAELHFYTTANNPGATPVPASRMTIRHTGGVAIGAYTGRFSHVQIGQSSTTGAVATLGLYQADVSEEFLGLTGQSAASDLTQSIIREASVTTATRAGFVKVFVTDNAAGGITDQAYYIPIFTLA